MLGDAIRSGTKWLFTANLGNQFLQFAFGVVLARLLLPSDFGKLVTIQIFTGFAALISTGGMSRALVRAKEVERYHFHVVFTIQCLFGCIIYSFFFVVAPYFAQWFGDPIYKLLLRVSTLSFLLRPFLATPNAILNREMRFQALAAINVITATAAGAATITMALMGFGIWSLVLGGFAGSIVNTICLMICTKWYPKFRYERRVIGHLGRFGFKLSVETAIGYGKSQTSNLMLSRLLGPSVVGLYNKADSLTSMPRDMMTGPLYQTLFRGFAKCRDDKQVTKQLYYKAIMLGSVYTMPVYLMIWWLADPFIRVVYGNKWVGTVAPLEILALSGLLLVGNPSGALIAAFDRLWSEIWMNIETWATLIVACLLGIHWGMVGIAWAAAANLTYSNVRVYSIARKCVGGTFMDLMRALKPAYMLNGFTMLVLSAAHLLFLSNIRLQHPAIYMLAMGGLGSVCYAILLLTLPMAELAHEAERWKNSVRSFYSGKFLGTTFQVLLRRVPRA